MGLDVPAPTHARSPSVDTGRAQPAEGNGIDAHTRMQNMPQSFWGVSLSRIHIAKGQDCVYAHPHPHTCTHAHTTRGLFSGYQQSASVHVASYFLTRKAFPPPFPRENKLLKCEMKPCLIKKGISRAGAILLVEQRSGRGDES